MISIKRARNYAIHNRSQFFDSAVKHFGALLPDKLYLNLRYRCQMGTWINWASPQTFTEKIQWLKIYGYRSEFDVMVDKLAAKEYVANLIGSQYIVPTIGVWNRVEDIDYACLPDKFVLKTSHGGGGTGVVVCNDKPTFDIDKASRKLDKSMAKVVGREYREKPYYKVPKKIFAEQLLVQTDADKELKEELIDYKFYCFNGNPQYCQVIRNRHTKETIDFYDMNWCLMPFVGLNPKCENGEKPLRKPERLDEMVEICKKLSMNIPFVRIDLYNVDNRPYFGEITFYPGGGFGRFSPEEWNEKLGSFIKLPHEN